MKKNKKKIFSLLDKDINLDNLYTQFPRIKYVSLITEEPLTELLLYEVELLLQNMCFSENKLQNTLTKLIIYLHCLGYTDLQISQGLHKILLPMSVEAVKKRRQRALNNINNFYGVEIGFVTLMYETFKSFEFLC